MKRIMLVLAILLAPCAYADNHDGIAGEVEAAMRTFNGAYESGDYETYFSYYTKDATLFFLGERQTVSDYYESWKATVESGFRYEQYALSDVRVQVLGEGGTAITSYFVDVRSRSADGEVAEVKAFESEVWEKIGDEWKIVSLHYTEF
ncbi:MAG: nuclear transport factor 2 family protein [Woeseiaceae bacterium]|nr:nuclear transport factor 2 family protein [Woeseiaceae bacterium]